MENLVTDPTEIPSFQPVEVLFPPPVFRLKPLMTSASPEWYTPNLIIDRVLRMWGAIDLDPAADPEKRIPAARHYTIKDDGLKQPWDAARVYCNPPYGRVIRHWAKKIAQEHENGHALEILALLPARTDTAWMREFAKYSRCFVWGRLKFSNHDNSAPFPSVVVYLGHDTARFAQTFGDIGDIYVRWSE